jgi:hypothetical protein
VVQGLFRLSAKSRDRRTQADLRVPILQLARVLAKTHIFQRLRTLIKVSYSFGCFGVMPKTFVISRKLWIARNDSGLSTAGSSIYNRLSYW